jgi:hypothetical protein
MKKREKAPLKYNAGYPIVDKMYIHTYFFELLIHKKFDFAKNGWQEEISDKLKKEIISASGTTNVLEQNSTRVYSYLAFTILIGLNTYHADPVDLDPRFDDQNFNQENWWSLVMEMFNFATAKQKQEIIALEEFALLTAAMTQKRRDIFEEIWNSASREQQMSYKKMWTPPSAQELAAMGCSSSFNANSLGVEDIMAKIKPEVLPHASSAIGAIVGQNSAPNIGSAASAVASHVQDVLNNKEQEQAAQR